MNNGLKKELAVLTGILALASIQRRSPFWTGLLSTTATGLFLSSLDAQYELRGKTAYITGGSRGLGLALARQVLKRGARVTLVARDQEELNQAKMILQREFPRSDIDLSVTDIVDALALEKSIDEAIERMNGIDLLINNAGSILVGPFPSMEDKDFEAQMKLHLYAALNSTQLIFPHFKARGGGRILNICSLGGRVAVPHMLPYNASKFALAGFSQGVTAELAAHNIQVTTAYPTVMRTGSPIQAVFKGEHEKEFAWFETIDHLPGLSMSAAMASEKIIDAVCDGKTEVVLSMPAKARLALSAFFPEVANAIMAFAAGLMPKGDSQKRQTGAQSSGLFQKSLLAEPLKQRVKDAETENNQVPRHSAEFNMGLH